MAKHAATTTRTIAPARGSERTIRADLRSRLLSGFLVTGRRLSLTNLSTAVLEGDDGSPIVLLHGPAAYAAQWRRHPIRSTARPIANLYPTLDQPDVFPENAEAGAHGSVKTRLGVANSTRCRIRTER